MMSGIHLCRDAIALQVGDLQTLLTDYGVHPTVPLLTSILRWHEHAAVYPGPLAPGHV